MSKSPRFRRVEVYRNDQWAETDGWDIKVGDVFRLFEGKKALRGRLGSVLFRAVLEPVAIDPPGNWAIEGDEVPFPDPGQFVLYRRAK
jgi:hypothetical protein